MMRGQRLFFLYFALLFHSIEAEKPQPNGKILMQRCASITHPTLWDYYVVQHFLRRGERPELERLETAMEPGGRLYDYKARIRRMRLVGKWPGEGPKFRRVCYGCSAQETEVCILSYASCNGLFARGIFRLRGLLKEVGFRGHFLYRIGGWPDVEGGSLQFAHVPYAFKPAFFREAKRLGYRLILWLDSSIRPLKELDAIFTTLKAQGYVGFLAGHRLGPYCNEETFSALGMDPVEGVAIPSLSAGIFGLNLDHPVGEALLNLWYAAAQDGFFSPRCDQNALSICAYQLGLNRWEAPTTVAWEQQEITDQTRFWVDRMNKR